MDRRIMAAIALAYASPVFAQGNTAPWGLDSTVSPHSLNLYSDASRRQLGAVTSSGANLPTTWNAAAKFNESTTFNTTMNANASIVRNPTGYFWTDRGSPVIDRFNDRVFVGIGTGAGTFAADNSYLTQSGWGWAQTESTMIVNAPGPGSAATFYANTSILRANDPNYNAIQSGSITNAGAGYTNGTYSNLTATGGSGSGAKLNITVAGGIVTVATIGLSNGSLYNVGDVLSASIPGGAGFQWTVASVYYPGAETVNIFADNAHPNSTVWGEYIEAVRRAGGAGLTQGLEIDVGNQGAYVNYLPTANYGIGSTNNLTLGLMLQCGGTFAPSYNNCSGPAMSIGSNGGSWSVGLSFPIYSIVGVTGQAGTAIGDAIRMIAGHRVGWVKPDGGYGLDISSTVTAAGTTGSQLVAEDSDALFKTDGYRGWLTDSKGNIVLSNAGGGAANSTSGFPYVPSLLAAPNGTPTSIVGYAPMAFDGATAKLHYYLGSWYSAATVQVANTFTALQTFSSGVQLTPITAATLGTCNAGAKGQIQAVSDGAAALAWGANIAGGGATYYTVNCNGANWTVMGK